MAAIALLASLAAGCAAQAGRGQAVPLTYPGQLHRMRAWGFGAPGLAINLPAGYELKTTEGDGYVVHLFHKPSHAEPSDASTLGIYVGHRPRAFRPESFTTVGFVGGQAVTWHGSTWQDQGKTLYHAETQVLHLFDAPDVWTPAARSLTVHLFAWGSSQDEVEALVEAAKSLRLDPGV
jgi:hypothetical protein